MNSTTKDDEIVRPAPRRVLVEVLEETIREDGTIIRTVGRAQPRLTYQYTDFGRPEPQ